MLRDVRDHYAELFERVAAVGAEDADNRFDPPLDIDAYANGADATAAFVIGYVFGIAEGLEMTTHALLDLALGGLEFRSRATAGWRSVGDLDVFLANFRLDEIKNIVRLAPGEEITLDAVRVRRVAP